jgi:hypothetical protein
MGVAIVSKSKMMSKIIVRARGGLPTNSKKQALRRRKKKIKLTTKKERMHQMP